MLIDDLTLQTNEPGLVVCIEGWRCLKGGHKALGAVGAWHFALDGKGGPRFLCVEKVDGTGQQGGAVACDQRFRLFIEAEPHLLFEQGRATNRGTEARPSQKSVDDAMTHTVSSIAYDVTCRVECLDTVARLCAFNVKAVSGAGLVEYPTII